MTGICYDNLKGWGSDVVGVGDRDVATPWVGAHERSSLVDVALSACFDLDKVHLLSEEMRTPSAVLINHFLRSAHPSLYRYPCHSSSLYSMSLISIFMRASTVVRPPSWSQSRKSV
jgi:hypothetical protein